jgi:uncharacterized protein YbaA (DUF1428 family)
MAKHGYADLYLLPLPKKNLEKYKNIASRFGKMARKCGALDYREFIGDDLSPKGVLSFKKASPLTAGQVLISAVVSFKSRSHRDQVMKKMMKDPIMTEMAKEEPLTDMSKMYYGGFKTIVDV